ncbi:hypothetical protein OVA24_13805 [Luteolibacter sp. SL250]|uniref:hypothetical protein n=1 Tax=Luteolibacter sp. SL250 TaxID=2995170 RepID=UPI00226D80F8|nr:hypothetical protein [Luteolibacter sp. SL250]WAC18309.1 hypothetical protein OVA24_13805 [Luteolibacter sp. SL250]
MKSPIGKAARIGTVAGLAALAATETAEAAAVLSTSISMVDLSTAADNGALVLDIDGDGTNDFSITGEYYGPNPALSFNGASTSAWMVSDGFAASTVGEGYELANGSLPNGASYVSTTILFDPFAGVSYGEFYAGVRFFRDGELHFGWLKFDMPTDGTLNGATLVSAGWESEAYAPSTVGAVPEASALFISAVFGGLAAGRRRR